MGISRNFRRWGKTEELGHWEHVLREYFLHAPFFPSHFFLAHHDGQMWTVFCQTFYQDGLTLSNSEPKQKFFPKFSNRCFCHVTRKRTNSGSHSEAVREKRICPLEIAVLRRENTMIISKTKEKSTITWEFSGKAETRTRPNRSTGS